MLVASHLDFLAETPEWQPLAAATPNLVDRLHRMHDRASFKTMTWQRVADLAKTALTERDNPLLGSGGQLTQGYPQRRHDVRDKSAFLGWMPTLTSLNASGDLTIGVVGCDSQSGGRACTCDWVC